MSAEEAAIFITELKTEFKTQGINQTVYRIYLELVCNLNIVTSYKNINTQKVIISNSKIIIKDMKYLIISIALLLIILIYIIIFNKTVIKKLIKKPSDYDKYVSRILRGYDRIIVNVKTAPKLENYNVVITEDINDMSGIIKEVDSKTDTGDLVRTYLNEISKNDYNKYYSDDTVNKYSRILKGDIIELSKDDIKSTGYVVDTLEASLWSFLNTDSFEEAVVGAVNLGGDTDTIGAITGSMAGIVYGKKEIPSRWLVKLKRKEYIEEMSKNFVDVLKTNNKERKR